MSEYNPLYVFSKIPNTDEGREFVDSMRQHLNRDRYKMRVRGQGLVKEADWRRHRYGAPLFASTHLRVYIEEKKQ